jgi:hypothetical protein
MTAESNSKTAVESLIARCNESLQRGEGERRPQLAEGRAMSTLALQDSVGGLHNKADAFREGRVALHRLNTGCEWSDWLGAAVAAGRAEAMRIANTNSPKGRTYNRAFGDVLKREQLGTDRLDSATRNQLLQIVENQSAIEEWRETLDPAQRLRLNHPSAVWHNWQRTVKGGGRDEQSKEVEQSGAEEEDAGPVSIIAALTTLIEQMRQRNFTKPKMNDLLAAKLSFDSNDLSELVALLGQLATELQEHVNEQTSR